MMLLLGFLRLLLAPHIYKDKKSAKVTKNTQAAATTKHIHLL